jgi:hypothetical protein
MEPNQRAARIQAVEKDIILPLRLMIITYLVCYFFFAGWFDISGAISASDWVLQHATMLKSCFVAYALLNLVFGAILIWARHLTLTKIEWMVFAAGVLDCILMGTLTFLCEPSGFDSKLYPVFAVLILHHAIAIPAAFPQLVLNFLTIGAFVAGGMLDNLLNTRAPIMDVEGISRENSYERVVVLAAWALCCYGVQMLFERQKKIRPRS